MYCKVNTGEKIVYNIAKKKVVAATKIADDDYKTMVNSINNNYTSVDLYLWNLTDDDYIVALDRSTNKLFNAYQDADFFCFICY